VERKIIINLVEGDDGPDLAVRFGGLDLSDYSSIAMNVECESGRQFSRTVTPDGVDPTLGAVAWQTGDLVRGEHQAEFEFVQSADSKSFTVPRAYSITLSVRKDLG